MTQLPQMSGAPREPKLWEPPQRPDPDRGRMDTGGGEGMKTHPPPNPTGSSRPMATTERRHGTQRRWRTRRQRRGQSSKPEARGARQHTPPARLWLQRREAQSAGPAPAKEGNQTTPGTHQHNPPPRLRPRRRESERARGRGRRSGPHSGRKGGRHPMECTRGGDHGRRGGGGEPPPHTVATA